ncbi:hypothetical protein BD769DRAFT_18404 [Suillus cothurnatus]|nr:hypothetical protein BD769DRAFT_18404 [Suillus cothurnatus]
MNLTKRSAAFACALSSSSSVYTLLLLICSTTPHHHSHFDTSLSTLTLVCIRLPRIQLPPFIDIPVTFFSIVSAIHFACPMFEWIKFM